MKILKKGKKKDEVWQGTCYDCGSKVGAAKDELHGHWFDQRDGTSGAHGDCPECKSDINFYKQ